MGSLRAEAQFDRAGWRLRILLPLWLLQLALTLAMTGLFAWRLGTTVKKIGDWHEADDVPVLQISCEGTGAVLACVASVCTMLEMGRFVAGSLTPWTVLLTHVVKLVCAGAILAADVVARVRSIDGRYTIIGMVLDGVFLVTASALAVYATVTYRRLSAKFNHDYSFDIRGYGFSDDRERGGGYLQGRRGAARAGFEKHRALSVVSSRLSTASSNQGRLEVPHLMEPLDRRSSVYSHERDTQFDDYLARRTSADLKADLEGAIGAELGWGRPRRGSSPSSPPPEDIVLSVGTVGSRPRGGSSPRAPSWVSDHVLLSVPEEEDDAAGAHEGREQREARAAEALLGGHGRRDSDDDGDVGAASPVPQGVDPVEPRWRRE